MKICKWEGSDAEHSLMLTYFEVVGNLSLRVGDDVLVRFRLKNVGKDDVVVDVFAVVEKPDGSREEVEPTRYDPLKVDEEVVFHAEVVVNQKGIWRIWPGFRILSHKPRESPERWHECSFYVESRPPATTITTSTTPLPDLDIIALDFDYNLNTGKWIIEYVVKNIGTARAGATVTKITVDGGRLTFYDSVGPLDPGDQVTRRLTDLEWACIDSQTTISIVVNYDRVVPESDYDNNGAGGGKADCGVDLVLEDVWRERYPRFPIAGVPSSIRIYIRVTNRGPSNLGPEDISATLYIDGDPVETMLIGPQPAKQTTNWMFSTSYECSGEEDEVRVVIQPVDTRELDNTNNVLERVWECSLPDLIVLDAGIRDEGQTVWFRVKNQGEFSAGENTASINIYSKYSTANAIELIQSAVADIPPLGPGEEYEVSFQTSVIMMVCSPETPYFVVDVTVDSEEEVRESEERNNFYRYENFFYSPCLADYPDLRVEDIWLDGHDVWARIRNYGGRSTDYQYQTLEEPCGEEGSSLARLIVGVTGVDYCVPRLGVGESIDIKFPYIFDWSNFQNTPYVYVRVIADFNDNVMEYVREDNNELEEEWRTPSFVMITGRILYQEADAPAGSETNKAPLILGGFKPFRYGKLYLWSLGGDYRSQVILTDSEGYFQVFVPRVPGRQLKIRIGGEEVLDGEMNYAVRVGKDFEGCNEYVGWNSINTIIIPESGDIYLGELKIGAEQNIDFEGYVQETYHCFIWCFCGWKKDLQGGSAYFNIAETILVAREYADAHRDDSDAIGRVTVAYPDLGPVGEWWYPIVGWLGVTPPAWQNPFTDEIYLSPPIEENEYRDMGFIDDAIIHEYAHHLSEQISENDWALAKHDRCYMAPDPWLDAGEFAWFEGFAEYFAHLLINIHSDPSDPRYLSRERTDFTWYENPECDGQTPSLLQEGGVTAFLIDLVDEPGRFIGWRDEEFDRISGLDDMIFKIFDTEMDNSVDAPDIFEFMYCPDGLLARARRAGYPSEEDIEMLWNNYHTLLSGDVSC